MAAGACLGLRPPVALQMCDVAGASRATAMLDNYLYASDVSTAARRSYLHCGHKYHTYLSAVWTGSWGSVARGPQVEELSR